MTPGDVVQVVCTDCGWVADTRARNDDTPQSILDELDRVTGTHICPGRTA